MIRMVKTPPISEFVLVDVDVALQLQRKLNLFALYSEVGKHSLKERSCNLTGSLPLENYAVSRIAEILSIFVYRTAVGFLECLYDGIVGYANRGCHLVSRVKRISFFLHGNSNMTFSVEQTCSVCVFHNDPLSKGWDGSEFGENPMPGSKECGRATPSQAGGQNRRACVTTRCYPRKRRYSLLSTGTWRSERKRLTPQEIHIDLCVTIGNTQYLHYRPSANRNMVPLEPDRFSVNQDAMVRLLGWAGNMTLSNGFLQGVIVT